MLSICIDMQSYLYCKYIIFEGYFYTYLSGCVGRYIT